MNGSPASYHPSSATGRSPTLSRSEFMTNHDSSTESSNLPSPTLPGPDMTAEILRIACMRGDLSDLQERILHAVLTTSSKNVPTTTTTTTTLGGDAVLRLLFACLRTLGVDFTPALSALKSTAIHRCTRCAASFCAADNTPTACAVPHAPPLVSWDIELVADGVEPCETRYYPCCGKCVVVFPEQPEEDTDSSISMCYVGPHAASVPAPIADAEHEHASEHKFEGPRSDYGCVDAEAGKTHLQARLPSVQGQGQGYTPGTCVPRPEFGTDEGKPVSPRTATWVNAVKSAADQHQYHQQQHLGWGRPPVDMNGAPNSAEWTLPDPRDATMTQTIPWRQSSLYHPPGWIAIPPGLRRPGDSPFA